MQLCEGVKTLRTSTTGLARASGAGLFGVAAGAVVGAVIDSWWMMGVLRGAAFFSALLKTLGDRNRR